MLDVFEAEVGLILLVIPSQTNAALQAAARTRILTQVMSTLSPSLTIRILPLPSLMAMHYLL